MNTRFQRITPFLWFDDNAQEAVDFYLSVFDDSRIVATTHYGKESAVAAGRREGSVMTIAFELDGGREAAWRLIDATQMLSITANLGDTKTTITHPATTTHGRLSAEERAAAGIGEGLVRIAPGIEAFEDIRDDLARGLR